ncbi:putative serine/threonine-protein kinase [Paramyrothecium foliicola]|nr:putative serine/threonine-protein kinase [Paramyrothecium foliicola]
MGELIVTDRFGASATVKTVRPGVVQKMPWSSASDCFARDLSMGFVIEPKILEYLGPHPRIVGYFGRASSGLGLLLQEASHGDLQGFLDSNPAITMLQRMKLCRQAAEALVFIHERGVLHSDLRPGNMLVHATSEDSLDLLLCDFGGSVCEALKLDGGSLPGVPFWHPAFKWETSRALDIFGLGSVIYTVLTGRWPYRDVPGRPSDGYEHEQYAVMAEEKMRREEFPYEPEVKGMDVIMKCWMRQYSSAQQVLDDLIESGFGGSDSRLMKL